MLFNPPGGLAYDWSLGGDNVFVISLVHYPRSIGLSTLRALGFKFEAKREKSKGLLKGF
jgi:hypothetical protein